MQTQELNKTINKKPQKGEDKAATHVIRKELGEEGFEVLIMNNGERLTPMDEINVVGHELNGKIWYTDTKNRYLSDNEAQARMSGKIVDE